MTGLVATLLPAVVAAPGSLLGPVLAHASPATAARAAAWGDSCNGALGNGHDCDGGPQADPVFPVSVSGLANVAKLTVGGYGTGYAQLGDGSTWVWGSNEYGVLGNPGAPGGIVPVSVAGGRSFSQISAGADHTCALEPGGAAWCWGLNAWGQLGVPSVTDACPAFGSAQLCAGSPVMVAGAPPLIAVSAGSGHTCGLTAEGEAWCWGRGQEGQLGDGLGMSSAAPVHVSRR